MRAGNLAAGLSKVANYFSMRRWEVAQHAALACKQAKPKFGACLYIVTRNCGSGARISKRIHYSTSPVSNNLLETGGSLTRRLKRRANCACRKPKFFGTSQILIGPHATVRDFFEPSSLESGKRLNSQGELAAAR